MYSSLYRVVRVSDRRWLGDLGHWTVFEGNAKTFPSRHEAERGNYFRRAAAALPIVS